MNPEVGEPQYFATWTGYQPPVKPHNPITYEVAEQSDAFSVFVFDETGRVAWFEKWLVHATEADPGLLGDRTTGPGSAFFAVAEGADGEESLGESLTLEGTRGSSDYFRTRPGTGAGEVQLQRVRRERMLRHEYVYWDDAGLREFRYTPGSGPGGVERYDRNGDLVSSTDQGGQR